MSLRLAITACMGLAIALAFTPEPARADNVGTAAAVRPSTTGTPPGGSARALQIGTGIVSKERIKTSGSGSLQVMFNDKTTMTIGPNSELVIDEFVYSPKKKGGSFAASLAKGTLRFVGGQVSHTSGAKIATPVAYLVIRGGAAFVSHGIGDCQMKKGKAKASAQPCTRIVCTGGKCTVRDLAGSRTIQLKINQAVEIGALGSARFDAKSVTLNDVAKGGKGGIVAGKSANNTTNFAGQSTVDQVESEQSPEPAPPAPPQ
jgi:hypothetical protein